MSEKLLTLRGEVEIQAADAGRKIPRVEILAYSGGEFSPGGWPNSVIDLAGADVSGEIPLLAGHADELDSIVGQGRATVRTGQLFVSGHITDATASGQKVVALAKSGVSLQASVGFAPDKVERIQSGQSVNVNGRTLKAGERGLTIIRSGRLREVSLLPIGADSNTTVTIAARRGDNSKGKPQMERIPDFTKPEDFPNEMRNPWDRDGLADDERIEARLAHFRKEHGDVLPDFGGGMVRASARGELSWADAEREILRGEVRALRLREIRAAMPPPPSIHGSTRDTQSAESVAAGIMVRAGFAKAAERQFGERTMNAADKLGRMHLMDLAENCLRAAGQSPESFGGREAMIKASLSTIEMPAALGLAGEKLLLDSYMQAPSPWREWCKIVSVASFRSHTILRPTFCGGFQQLAPSGEIKHANVTEETAEIMADTYAKVLSIDRQQLINDDAGAFGQAAESMGKAAMRKLNDLVIGTLLAGAEVFFTTGRGNLIADALSVAAVANAVARIRSAVDNDKNNLDITPKVLLVGPALETLAVAICKSEFIESAEGSPTGNSLRDVLVPVVDPRMANATLGGSATAWAVLAGPSDAPQAVAFLGGKQTPTIETMGLEAKVDSLAFHWRAFHDFGTALVDWRAGVLSTGVGD